MGRVPKELRETIARNIRECRMKAYPGRGGAKQCAEDFGVSPQQWSPWERAMRTPDELRLSQIAEFFGVSVAFLRGDGSGTQNRQKPEPGVNDSGGAFFTFMNPHASLSGGLPDGGHTTNKVTIYVPVFVMLPHLPEDLKVLVEQFNTVMNKRHAPGEPPAKTFL